ncbi:EamA family transporter [Corynebacterium pyruviciproducens]|uniref:EamA family transporter n=1 Tax=Corynebacterium pyruviciproducens TaxID=598660 RepID=A0AAF0YYP2_9CORY|nr:EamA family transporter [Corynebacterium pyruviciproducens]MDK6565364.1 EamA family transporter [Corynebacterium pyruviciproducens]WOT02985.1 EamA family transporter [Corynebacterium pyruviciproducens]
MQKLYIPLLMILSGTSNYLGAALAVNLFGIENPWIVAWMRVGAAGIIIALALQPSLTQWLSWQALIYGVVTLGMNTSFYEAIQTIPLGMAVAIEFIGPICVAAWGSRTVRDWIALCAAATGVVVLSGTQWGANFTGILWILASAFLWAMYILVSNRLASSDSTFHTMGVGLTCASLLVIPLVAWRWEPIPATGPSVWLLIAMAIGLGLLSAVIPFVLDLIMLKSASPDYYAVLLALLPVTAAVIGMIALGQIPSAVEVLGILLIVIAVTLRKQTA